MKKTALLLLAALLLLTLPACAAPAFLTGLFSAEAPDAPDAILIYRVASDPHDDGGSLIRTSAHPSSADSASDPGTILALFTEPDGDDGLECALPADVSVEGWSLENGVVTLELSPTYLEHSEMTRTVAALCAALTLCQLDDVDAVTVVSDGQTVFAGLMAEDAFLDDADADPYTRQLRLYFPEADGRYLISEYHSLTLDEDTSPERYVIEELLRGPNNGELGTVLPEGTALRYCTTSEDGVCTVSFSSEFYLNRPDTALGERLVLCAVVNSLTALPGVDSVRILVEGLPVGMYVYRSLSEPLERYDEAVGPVSVAKGELDADLYLILPGLDGITPLPFRVSGDDYASPEEAVLSALLNAAEPDYPPILSGSGSVIGLNTQGAVCTVDLSEGFFVSLPEQARDIAVRSIAATICALPEIDAVRFTVGGEDAVFDGVDYAGPWTDFEDIEVP